jgi:hypothetical protein
VVEEEVGEVEMLCMKMLFDNAEFFRRLFLEEDQLAEAGVAGVLNSFAGVEEETE